MQLFYSYHSLISHIQQENAQRGLAATTKTHKKQWLQQSNSGKKKKRGLGLDICFSPILLQNYFGGSP